MTHKYYDHCNHNHDILRVLVPCFLILIAVCFASECFAVGEVLVHHTHHASSRLLVNASQTAHRRIPQTLFGVFFEEINHAGAGGLWAELVSNRGFEAGGPNTPSNIEPWSVIGEESYVRASTDRTSCFDRNKVALRLDILCDTKLGPTICPHGGVGVYNPGFWGMNIEQGKSYKLILYVRSVGPINVYVSLTGTSNGLQKLATISITASASDVSKWRREEAVLKATGTDHNSRLELTTRDRGVIWFDQISVMPLDTYQGHGFRNDLLKMAANLNPQFVRFPGGCFVEGEWLRNAFRWKESIGPWEERAGHFGDVWKYWTDDGFGFFEFLLLAEDLTSFPIWVFNNGISHQDQVNTSNILPFVQEALDGIEFARGEPSSKWGSVRASMGHSKPFDLRYVAIGNEDCDKTNYKGNYLKFYSAIREAYPDIKIISNCDGSSKPLDHPADLYDYHVYSSANDMFSLAHHFDHSSRDGPKAFVSEYAVTGKDAGKGSLFAALAEAGFLMGLEKNSDVVEMVSYAPLFVNVNQPSYPDTIVFDSWRAYGTPSYWVQSIFKESSGATLLDTVLETEYSSSIIASAISWRTSEDHRDYIRIKIVNFGSSKVSLKISIEELDLSSKPLSWWKRTVITSDNLMDENSFNEPKRVFPIQTSLKHAGKEMDIELSPYSLTSFDLSTKSRKL